MSDKKICGWYYRVLEKQGYIQLNHFTRLLPDGTVIRSMRELELDGDEVRSMSDGKSERVKKLG